MAEEALKQMVRDWDARIELMRASIASMESGDVRVYRDRDDVTAGAIATQRGYIDELVNLLTEIRAKHPDVDG